MHAQALGRRTFISALAAACVSCRRSGQPGRDRPLVIVFGQEHAPRNPDALRSRLEQASQLKLELIAAESSNAAIDRIQAGRADAGLLSLFDYLYCADVLGVEPLAQVQRAGDRTTHAGELVVLADSPLQKLSELSGKRVGYVDRFSVTGFILPAAQLSEARVGVEAVWLGSHDAVFPALREGRVLAGATYSGHAASEQGLRVLASTGDIANEPLFVRSSLPADVRDALRSALLSERDPSALDGLAGATGFRAPAAAAYETALATVRAAGKRVEDLVPGGWVRANDQRRPMWAYGH